MLQALESRVTILLHGHSPAQGPREGCRVMLLYRAACTGHGEDDVNLPDERKIALLAILRITFPILITRFLMLA